MNYKSPKNKMKMKDMGPMDEEECLECPDHSDLLLLRDAAAGEREAIALYLKAAKCGCFPEVFLDVAQDEMHHFMMLMHHITMLDPVQAEALKEENLDMLVMTTKMHMYKGMHIKGRGKAKWMHEGNMESMGQKGPMEMEEEDTCATESEEECFCQPDDTDWECIEYLTNALKGELCAINQYQRYMNESQLEHNARLFCLLMNDEKDHVADFTAALYSITHEPPDMEND